VAQTFFVDEDLQGKCYLDAIITMVDAAHIVVGNDNNLPFSSSRDPNKADDNELVLLEVGEFLKAR
jgi:G3E family GTPase